MINYNASSVGASDAPTLNNSDLNILSSLVWIAIEELKEKRDSEHPENIDYTNIIATYEELYAKFDGMIQND